MRGACPILLGLVICPAVVSGARPNDNVDPNVAWLDENAGKEGVIRLPSGLQYKILASGPETGERPKAPDKCTCHYEGAASFILAREPRWPIAGALYGQGRSSTAESLTPLAGAAAQPYFHPTRSFRAGPRPFR